MTRKHERKDQAEEPAQDLCPNCEIIMGRTQYPKIHAVQWRCRFCGFVRQLARRF